MGTVTLPYTIQNGDTDAASREMDNFNALLNEINGELDNDNIASDAAITNGKLDLSSLAVVNLINNGDMEGWDAGASTFPAGWVTESVPAAVARDTAKTGHGAYCVKITTTDANDGMNQTISNLKASTVYRISCLAKATSGDTAKLLTTGGSTNISDTTTSTSWTTLSGTVTTDGSGTDVVVKVVGSGGAGDIVWFDSIVMTEGSAKMGYLPNRFSESIVYVNADSDAVSVKPYGQYITIMADTSAGNVTIGGLANGVDGQVVRIIKNHTDNSLVIEHNESTGTQKIYTPGEDDLTLSGYGGVTLVMLAGVWYQVAE